MVKSHDLPIYIYIVYSIYIWYIKQYIYMYVCIISYIYMCVSYIYICVIYIYMCVIYIYVSYIYVCHIYIYMCVSYIYMCHIYIYVCHIYIYLLCMYIYIYTRMCIISKIPHVVQLRRCLRSTSARAGTFRGSPAAHSAAPRVACRWVAAPLYIWVSLGFSQIFMGKIHGRFSWEIFMGDFHGKVMGQLGLGRISGGIE